MCKVCQEFKGFEVNRCGSDFLSGFNSTVFILNLYKRAIDVNDFERKSFFQKIVHTKNILRKFRQVKNLFFD